MFLEFIRGSHIDFDKKVLHYILAKASSTSNPSFITRNIPKIIQKNILEPIAEKILKNTKLKYIKVSIHKGGVMILQKKL